MAKTVADLAPDLTLAPRAGLPPVPVLALLLDVVPVVELAVVYVPQKPRRAFASSFPRVVFQPLAAMNLPAFAFYVPFCR